MELFIILMAIGLAGLLLMAIPGLGRHGSAGHSLSRGGHTPPQLGSGHGHALAHVAHGHAPHAGTSGPHTAGSRAGNPTSSTGDEAAVIPGLSVGRLLPSPRAIFSILTLYGAFGYALADAAHLGVILAAVIALFPAILIERFAVTPLWNLMFRFQGQPSAPLQDLLMDEVVAVTPFRNGRGIVRAVHDGRMVQLSARLTPAHAALPVGVGDKLKVEDVDPGHERVMVSLS